jgi:TolB-like protein/Tfp pilus assembly protein PilF
MMPDTGSPPGYKRFLADLKRRQVFKVAAVYGAVAFVVLQVADLLQEGLQLPASFLTVVTVLSLLGFPIAIVLAWAYERTPEGVKRTVDAAPGELTQIAAASATKRWPIGLAGVAGGALLAASAFWILSGTRARVGGDSEAVAPPAASVGDSAAHPVNERSVAVLPFAVQTDNDESREFAAGLHDDLLTQLARIPDLAVTSRTSVMTYENTTKSIDEIADELGVASLIEGGVRRAGRNVRINVQLIDADTDEHLWAETFDREYTAENVFAVQTDIAAAVAAALESELSEEDVAELTVAGTESIEAWNAYHRGRSLMRLVGDTEKEVEAVAELKRAVELDPGFVAAWSDLVNAEAWLLRIGYAADTLPARRALDRLEGLAPGSAQAHLAAGYYRYYAHADFEPALAEFETAARMEPNDPSPLEALGYITRRLGQWEESIAFSERVMLLDPRNAGLIGDAGFSNHFLRRVGVADALFERSLELQPDGNLTREEWAQLRLASGDIDGARAVVDRPPGFSNLGRQVGLDWTIAMYRRDYETALRAVKKAGAGDLGVPSANDALVMLSRWVMRAVAYRQLGDMENATFWADSAVLMMAAAVEGRPVPPTGDRFGVAASALVGLASGLALSESPGDVERAVGLVEQAIVIYGIDRDAVDGATLEYQALLVLALAGDRERTLEQIDRLLAVPSPLGPGELEFSPIYDPYREDPRFQAQLARAKEMYGQ